MTSVGRLYCAITFAIVNVLPLPVTPSSVWCFLRSRNPSTSLSTASGWSPVIWKSEARRKAVSVSMLNHSQYLGNELLVLFVHIQHERVKRVPTDAGWVVLGADDVCYRARPAEQLAAHLPEAPLLALVPNRSIRPEVETAENAIWYER